MNRLETTFTRLRDKGEKALIAYLMAGDPTLDDTEAYVQQLAQTGADIIELRVPFSDPNADRPVIQQAPERVLPSGTPLKKTPGAGPALTDKADVEKKVREIRRYTKTPVAVGFGIATPEDAREVSRIADGVIVGSALVKIIAEGNHSAVTNRLGSFTRSLKAATLPA